MAGRLAEIVKGLMEDEGTSGNRWIRTVVQRYLRNKQLNRPGAVRADFDIA